MKRFIRAQAFPKDKALQRSGFYSDSIIEHVIKIVLYSDVRRDDVLHWITEIANWLEDADNIIVKTSAKKLKRREIEDTTFGWMGDSLRDYASVLKMFQHNNRKGKFNYEDKESYPEVDITPELAEELMEVCYSLMDATLPMICEKTDHTSDEYVNVLKKVFRNYL